MGKELDISPEEQCNVCKYQSMCLGRVREFGNGPVFPPCVDRDDWLDKELLAEYLEDKNE